MSKRKKNYPLHALRLQRMWEDVEDFDLRGDHRGQLCTAMATLQLAEEVQALRVAIKEMIDAWKSSHQVEDGTGPVR